MICICIFQLTQQIPIFLKFTLNMFCDNLCWLNINFLKVMTSWDTIAFPTLLLAWAGRILYVPFSSSASLWPSFPSPSSRPHGKDFPNHTLWPWFEGHLPLFSLTVLCILKLCCMLPFRASLGYLSATVKKKLKINNKKKKNCPEQPAQERVSFHSRFTIHHGEKSRQGLKAEA